MLVWLCVAVRIVANPASNVFQKLLTQRQAEPLLIVCVTHGALSLACLPAWFEFREPLSQAFWLSIFACAFLAVAGNVLIVEAVRRSDLSLLGPINACKPVVSLVPAAILLGELPSLAGLAGVGLIVAGSLGLADRGDGASRRVAIRRLLADRGVQCRMGALVLSSTEAVIFKRAVLESSALAAFVAWSTTGFCVSTCAAAAVLPRDGLARELVRFKERLPTFAFLVATTGLMQLCTAIALARLEVGYTLALFQLSALVSVILGHRLFGEPHFARRFAGALVMVAGAALILVAQ